MGTMRSLPRRASALLSGLEENLVVSISVAQKRNACNLSCFSPKIWWFHPNIFMFFWDDMG